VLRNAVWTYGRATSFARPLPDFLILGAQKAGTTALYAYLRWHPEITGPSWKEVSYFDRHYRRGLSWYRGHFPIGAGDRLVGEASPGYLFHPLAPERVRATVPDAKLIALLRDPVDRALSHYHHEVALGREPLSFDEALEAEPERTRGEDERLVTEPGYFSHAWWDYTYLARGRYAAEARGVLRGAEPAALRAVGPRLWVAGSVVANRCGRADHDLRRGCRIEPEQDGEGLRPRQAHAAKRRAAAGAYVQEDPGASAGHDRVRVVVDHGEVPV
jgi:hypothetical protein